MIKKIAIFPIFFFILFSCSKGIKKNVPVPKNGILDLREWNLEKDGPVNLNGQWKFYWNKFVPPGKLKNIKDYSLMDVPAQWNGKKIKTKKLSAHGYATYYLKILNNARDRIFALKFQAVFTAYKCYVNGKEINSVGKIGTTSTSMLSKFKHGVSIFHKNKNDIEIVIHVSNFNYKKGGLGNPILFGEAEDLLRIQKNNQKEELFVFGILFIMFLYHLALFILRTKDKLPLIFGVFCLLISIRVIVLGEKTFMEFFPSLSMDWLLTIEYLTYYLIIFFAAYFIQKSFPDDFNKKSLWVWFFITAIYIIVTLFTPAKTFSSFVTFFQIITIIICIQIIATIVIAIYKKRDGSIPIFIGFLASTLATINDVLHLASILNTGNFFYYGVLMLIFCKSYMISSKFSKAIFDVENLSLDLQSKNKELNEFNVSLENKVKERTRDLESANEQMSVINENLKTTTNHLWGEMQLAKKIQTVLLPLNPVIDGYEIVPFMKPADDVGGDYYDIINCEGYDWLVIGDVSGHGVSAGLIMMMVQTSIHTVLDLHPDYDPAKLIVAVNKTIKKNLERLDESKYMTITVFAAFKEGTFIFSGLHQDILIYRQQKNELERIKTDGFWLGLYDDVTPFLANSEFNVNIGDIFLLFTDGITEAWKKGSNPDKRIPAMDMYGDKKLLNEFKKHAPSMDLIEIKDKILESLNDYDYDDDITLVLVKRVE